MKTGYVLSDVHVDFLYRDNNPEHTYEEFAALADKWLTGLNLPPTYALIVAGDISNDFQTFTYFCFWISDKYSKTYIVPGNHDMVVRGSTPSTSNQQFQTSFDRIEAMKKECAKYDNVVLLDGDIIDGIGGTMGMCDFEYRPSITLNYPLFWKMHWFDGKHWRLDGTEPLEYWKLQQAKMHAIIDKQPKVVMTHFAPVQVGVPFEYRNDNCSCFFYFNGEEFLERMPNDSYWICGHTHDFHAVDYTCNNGNVVHILCNPHGYPGEQDYNWHDPTAGYKKENFIIPLPE